MDDIEREIQAKMWLSVYLEGQVGHVRGDYTRIMPVDEDFFDGSTVDEDFDGTSVEWLLAAAVFHLAAGAEPDVTAGDLEDARDALRAREPSAETADAIARIEAALALLTAS